MDWSALPVPVASLLQGVWSTVKDVTSAENGSAPSRIIRIVLSGLLYCSLYTKVSGTLLNAMVYLVDHSWYLLAVTCSVVVLGISYSLLILYEWMWHWQSQSLVWLSPSAQSTYRRIVTHDVDDEDATWQTWAKKVARGTLIVVAWAFYCWGNVRLDYMVFWSQYSDAHPRYNLELLFVNSLQAAPILVGAVYTISLLFPAFYQPPSNARFASTSPVFQDPHMQSLIS
jgi:hypothetical protein